MTQHASRNNRLPHRFAMKDEARDMQTFMGHGLFEMMQLSPEIPRAAPAQLRMNDNESDEDSDSANEMERLPLLKPQ